MSSNPLDDDHPALFERLRKSPKASALAARLGHQEAPSEHGRPSPNN